MAINIFRLLNNQKKEPTKEVNRLSYFFGPDIVDRTGNEYAINITQEEIRSRAGKLTKKTRMDESYKRKLNFLKPVLKRIQKIDVSGENPRNEIYLICNYIIDEINPLFSDKGVGTYHKINAKLLVHNICKYSSSELESTPEVLKKDLFEIVQTRINQIEEHFSLQKMIDKNTKKIKGWIKNVEHILNKKERKKSYNPPKELAIINKNNKKREKEREKKEKERKKEVREINKEKELRSGLDINSHS